MPKYEVVPEIPANYKKLVFKGGTNGKCYLTADGDVYKEFSYQYPYDYELGVMSDVESKIFAFPSIIVYKGEYNPKNLDGYRMPLKQGFGIKSINPNTPMEALVNGSFEVEDEIIRIARAYGIVLDDVKDGNVLFGRDNRFGIYDTDLYRVYPFEEEYDNMKQSMKEWNNYLLYNLGCEMEAFYSDKLNLHTSLALDRGKFRASELMEEMMTEMRTQARIDPVTLGQFNEGMKLIRRP